MKENRFGWRHSLANVNRLLGCFCLCFWAVSAIVRSALCEKGCISIIVLTEKSELSLGASSSWLWCMSLSSAWLCWCMSMRKRFLSIPKQPCPLPKKLGLSTRGNIKGRFAATLAWKLWHYTMFSGNGHRKALNFGKGEIDTSHQDVCRNINFRWMYLATLENLKLLVFTKCKRMMGLQDVFLWTTMNKRETQWREILRELLHSPK